MGLNIESDSEVPARKYHNHKPSHRLRAGLEGCGPDRGCHPFEARRAKMRTERLRVTV